MDHRVDKYRRPEKGARLLLSGSNRHLAGPPGGKATPVCLRQTLNRQTGMYRVTRKLTDDQAQNLVKEACRSDSRCLRTILWGIEENQSPDFLPSSKSDPTVDQTGQKRAALPVSLPGGLQSLGGGSQNHGQEVVSMIAYRCRTLVTMDWHANRQRGVYGQRITLCADWQRS